jgi:hypothetical protein
MASNKSSPFDVQSANETFVHFWTVELRYLVTT